MPYAYSVSLLIAGVERNFQPASLNLENIGLGRTVLRFTLNSTAVGVNFTRAAKGDTAVLIVDGDTVFDGIVWSIDETRLFENVGVIQTVDCVDYGKLSEKVPINEPHPAGTLQDALDHIVVNMAAHGITAATLPSPGPDLPDMLWVWMTMRQVIEMVSTTSGFMPVWTGSVLSFTEPGATPAPFDVDDIEPNWISIRKKSTLEDKWNGVWGRYGPRGQLLKTEVFEGDGVTTSFELEIFLILVGGQVTPNTFVTVHRTGGDTEETTDADLGGTEQWHYDAVTNRIVQNTGASAVLGVTETVTIQYTGDSPGAVFALDDADYIANGPFLTIIDNPNIEDRTQATAWIEGKLQELIGDNERVMVTSDRKGLVPFQALFVNVGDFLLDGDYLILKTQMQHVAKVVMPAGMRHRFIWSIECVLGNVYRANWERFFRPNAGNPGTGGASLYTQPAPGGCAASTGLVVFTDNWNSAASPDDLWNGDSNPTGTAVLATGPNGSPAWDKNGVTGTRWLNKPLGVQIREGCCEFQFKSAGLADGAGGGIIEIGWSPASSVDYIGGLALTRTTPWAEGGTFGLDYVGGGFGQTTLPTGFFSTIEFDQFRIEFKISDYSAGVYSNNGYARLYKNGILIVNLSGLTWVPPTATPGLGINTLEAHPHGVLDSVTLRALVASADQSGSQSPSSSMSPSPSPGNSPSLSPSSSPSRSVSPSASTSPSSSVSPSASVSPTLSPSASVSPSSSPSRSASASVSPSSSVSRSPSASVSPSSSPSSSPSPTPSSSISPSVSPSSGAGFPFVRRVAESRVTASATAHPIAIPSGVVSGDLLTVFFTASGNPTVSIGSGTGWTIQAQQGTAGNAVKGAVISKIADGNDALTLTTSTSATSTQWTYAFADADGISLTAASTTGSNTNPPSHTPPNGALNYLWLVFRAAQIDVPVSPPTNYGEERTRFNSGATTVSTVVERELNAASEDPGAFSSFTSEAAVFTIAIEPV